MTTRPLIGRIPDIGKLPTIACDVEATGLSWWKDRMFAAAFAWRQGGEIRSTYLDIRDPKKLAWAKDQLEAAGHIVNHHAKYDAHFIREAGIQVRDGVWDCTMIRQALIDENTPDFSLNTVAREYGLEGKTDDIWEKMASLRGGKPTREDQIGHLSEVPENLVAPYACRDAEQALQVYERQRGPIEVQELTRVAQVERELLQVVIDMERGGVRVDLPAATHAERELNTRIETTQKELDRLAGFAVNANSPKQIQKLVEPKLNADGYWQASDGTFLESTAGGGPSIRTHALYAMRIPAAKLVAQLRGLIKARDVFVRKYVLGMSHNSYIHASINQTRTDDYLGGIVGTGTGRFSITEPALQQIHKRDKVMAAIIRALFIPDEGHEWFCADYAQIDFRCFAHYISAPIILQAYADNPEVDFHALVAEVTSLPRNRDEKTGGANSKQINLGLIFGMGEGKLAREMGLPHYRDERGYVRAGPEAAAVFKKYHTRVPGVRGFLERAERVAQSRGYIKTPLGRHIRFPNPRHAYKAGGLLFQGAAADILKMKMVEVYKLLRGTPARLMLTVHDEFGISALRNDELAAEVKSLLERFDGVKTPMQFRVPIRTSIGWGINWWEASK